MSEWENLFGGWSGWCVRDGGGLETPAPYSTLRAVRAAGGAGVYLSGERCLCLGGGGGGAAAVITTATAGGRGSAAEAGVSAGVAEGQAAAGVNENQLRFAPQSRVSLAFRRRDGWLLLFSNLRWQHRGAANKPPGHRQAPLPGSAPGCCSPQQRHTEAASASPPCAAQPRGGEGWSGGGRGRG